ncbi:hypothetical protein ABZ929_19540 [Streptomyces physcomitrii]|uniref:hypothetical protein n=1 Tax=Streptomyces physcomitrii TaxID=2724184 RepID=UPI00344A80D1
MQQSAVPELAHATTRPIHWVATAAAVAAVLAGSSFLQPDHATAAQPDKGGTARSTPVAAPDPDGVRFPLDCGPVAAKVQQWASGDLDGDGRPETVAAVRCDAGSGSPPDGVYVLTQPSGKGGKPRVVATLLDPKDRENAADLTVRDGRVAATLLGYSSPEVPSCCPDRKQKVSWHWQDGAFARSTGDQARTV